MVNLLNVGSRGPRKTIEQRFWSKVVRAGDTDCWIWTGAKTRIGYGNFWDGTYRASGGPRMVEAHRWAYRHFVAEPGSMHVRHSCDIYPCVNFMAHLKLGTVGDNMRDRDERGRGVVPDMRGFARGRGPKLTAEQVCIIRSTDLSARGSQERLAADLGVARQTINDIVNGRRWPEI